ncbi:MAG: L-aspartate oxidase [Acidobacteria bacterium]|nr:L-aspartate oxidase [Acidobacteriota bacterium]
MADLECDFLIVGSGIAALRAAIELADDGQTVVLTKGGAEQGSTAFAQGGIAAAVGDADSPELHAADTLAAGDGLCRPDAVRVLTTLGPRYVRELIDWGARFDRETDGRIALAREAAHSVRRVLHARDATGREISRLLWQRVSALTRVRVIEHALAVDAVVADGRCTGARYLDGQGRQGVASAAATLLATGGAGQLFRETTNPPVATGDGIAIAYRAGARMADLEFVQFHPTALDVDGAPRFLLSEALRGEGAVLVNEAGVRFMQHADPAGDLAPRDRVARAIAREAERSGGRVYLTLEDLPPDFVQTRFPTIAAACARAGLDLARDRIPVGPAAHYLMGGVDVDLDGRTSLSGLFAAGEVACSGVHGANRLASNSLLEGLVFGAVAGVAMRRWAAENGRPVPSPGSGARASVQPERASGPTESEVRDLMWRDVGLFRDGPRLARARDTLGEWEAALEPAVSDPDAARLTSLVTVGCLMARAALRREESRGAHYRSDFPERNDIDWARHVTESRNGETGIDAGRTGPIRH